MDRHLYSGGRYPVLRSLAIMYVIGAGLSLVGGLMLAGWALFGVQQPATDRLILVAGILAGTFFACVTMLALAEIIKLAIDVERNTRTFNGVTTTTVTGGEMRVDREVPTGRMSQWLSGEETAEGALLRGR
jgi:hypothetical protein